MHRSFAIAVVLFIFSMIAVRGQVFSTGNICEGPFGCWGIDAARNQSVAVHFTVPNTVKLANMTTYFMSNDFNASLPHPSVSFILTAGNERVPYTDKKYESWTVTAKSGGFDPEPQVLKSTVNPILTANNHYWLISGGSAVPGKDAVWVMASKGGIMATSTNNAPWVTIQTTLPSLEVYSL